MKVRIRKYPTWFGPHQLVDAIFFWAKDEDWVYNVGKWYSDTWLGNLHYKLADRYMQWKESRRVKVELDPWDTWSMDHTLAYIVLPMLKQLKETKHGAPAVEFKDVPEELHPPEGQTSKLYTHGKTDDNYYKRWDWVLDEMIYAFDCKANKDEPYMRIEDIEEIKKEQQRISNGFRLFGKYYENLWD